jgi:hypothetical protein
VMSRAAVKRCARGRRALAWPTLLRQWPQNPYYFSISRSPDQSSHRKAGTSLRSSCQLLPLFHNDFHQHIVVLSNIEGNLTVSPIPAALSCQYKPLELNVNDNFMPFRSCWHHSCAYIFHE